MTQKIILDNPVLDLPDNVFGSDRSRSSQIKSTTRLFNIATAVDGVNINEPSTPSHGEYGYIDAKVTNSGHVKEYDDTPGAERVFEMHKSGTFYEVHPDGTKVTKVFGDNWEISLEDKNIVVSGNMNIVVNGDATFLVKGSSTQKIDGDLTTIVNGNYTMRVAGQIKQYSKGDTDIQTNSNLRLSANIKMIFNSQSDMKLQTKSSLLTNSKSQTKMFASGPVFIDGSTIDLNMPSPNHGFETISSVDISSGLTVSNSLFEPSYGVIKSNVTLNYKLPNTDDNPTFPRDRVKNTN